eukprot:EC123915.1.p1 GENE.EC123915.1~~EC123915.1.p1  ORF type:complete len:222 (+),score=47.43 EC123915.1:76-666(+)
MDSLLGFVGDFYFMLAANTTNARSVVVMNTSADKIMELDETKLLACGGEVGDSVQFCEYIQKNVHLYKYRTGIVLSTNAAANYTRGELARFLRESPYQVSLLLAGCNPTEGPALYYMDYLASMQKMEKSAHGYGSYFALSILDRKYRPGLSLEEGLDLMNTCIKEIQLRLVLNNPKFIIKIVDKDRTRTIDSKMEL